MSTSRMPVNDDNDNHDESDDSGAASGGEECQKKCLMGTLFLVTLPCLPCLYLVKAGRVWRRKRKARRRSKLPVVDIQDDAFLSHKESSDDESADERDNINGNNAAWRSKSGTCIAGRGGSRYHESVRQAGSSAFSAPPQPLLHGQNSEKGRVVHIHQAYNPIPHPPVSSVMSSPVTTAPATKPAMAR